MKVVTYEATVENGQIKLTEPVRIPDHTKVYVVVPGVVGAKPLRAPGPRLADREKAADFVKEVVEVPPHAGV